MRPVQVIIMLVMIDLFLYYGAVAIGGFPDAGDRSFSNFVNVTSGGYTNDTGELADPADISPTVMVLGTGDLLLNSLNAILGLLSWMWTVLTMPFVISSMMGLTGAAALIPATIYTIMLVFALGQILSGRDM